MALAPAGLGGSLHELMQGPDPVNPKHRAAKFTDRRPCQALLGMKGFEPMLYVDRFDIVRDSFSPLRDKVGVDDM